MATAGQVKALLESHGQGDDVRFWSVALEIADNATKNGKNRYAEEVRDLVEEGRRASPTGQTPPPTTGVVVQPRGELAQALTVAQPSTRLSDMALGSDLLRRLRRVLQEQRRQETLRAHGFDPMRKLLLSGPSGTGKTLTAEALAGELRVPAFAVSLDGLVDTHAEEAVPKLRLVFDLMSQSRGVYLFDALDALVEPPGHTGSTARQLTRSFLNLLEQDRSTSVLVVTTNRPEVLDRTILRRFDALVDYPLPSAGVVQDLVQRRLRRFDLSAVEWPRVVSTASGLNHEEIAAAAELAGKQAVLEGRDDVETTALLNSLRQRRELLKMAP